MHPIGLLAAVLLGMAMLLLPRRYAIAPMIIMACFVSPAQRIVIASLDFDLLRVMVLFGWARIFCRNEFRYRSWNMLDLIFLGWACCSALAMTLLHGTGAMMINRLGWMFDSIGMYFLFRCLIRNWDDFYALSRTAAIISIPIAVFFLIEQMTARNMFAIFGGVPHITTIREGRLRCQGAFSHPILAGCFWAVLFPIIVTLWNQPRSRFLAAIGAIASLLIIYTTASSTPFSAMIFGVSALMLFAFHRFHSLIKWIIALTLIELHLVMHNPVWHLLARADLVNGSTGWYRYKLFDEFIRHINEWWILGTANWSSWWDDRIGAITNQYVAEGAGGGIITLALFCTLILVSYRLLGQGMSTQSTNRAASFARWALGSSLFIHCVSFFGVAYFGQMTMVWYLSLALIAGLAIPNSRSINYHVRKSIANHRLMRDGKLPARRPLVRLVS